MCGTQRFWSSSCASSSSLGSCGSLPRRKYNRDDLFLVSRCSLGFELSGPHVMAVLNIKLESVSTSGPSKDSFPELKGAFEIQYTGSLNQFRPCVRHSASKRHSTMAQAVVEGKNILLEKPCLLQVRRPSSVKKDIKMVFLDSREDLEAPSHAPNVFRFPKRYKQNLVKVKNPTVQHLHQLARSRGRSSGCCNPEVDEVIAALKQRGPKSTTMHMVMEQYANIFKTDISGILTELQHRQDLQCTLEFFEWMKQQNWYHANARQYTKLIGFLGREGKVDLACLYFQEMVLAKCKPDQYTFTAMVNAYGKAKMYNEALAVFSKMQESEDPNCKPTTVTCNALIDALVKGGQYDMAFKIFIDMKEGTNKMDSNCIPNVVTYNILVDGLCKEGHVALAVQVLYRMSEGGAEHFVTPNVTTYNTLINACGKVGLIDKAEELMEHMIESGLKADQITYTALIDAYGKAGHCESAENLFKGMRGSHIQVDVMAYTAMIDAYARDGRHERAENLFKTMCDSGIRPNQVTYLALIEAYGKSGLPLEAKKVFMSMQKEGFRPNVLHYSALIDAYGKVGLYKNAADVYMTMKRTGCCPNLVTLSAILSSCSKCKIWDDAKVLIRCLQCSGSELELAVYNVLMGEETFWGSAFETLERIKQPKDLRKSLYNALMEVMWQFGMKTRAAKVAILAKKDGIYSDEYFKEEWNIDLHGLSVGGAMVALLTWLHELHLTWLWGEDTPARLRVITGKGKHSRSKLSALKSPVESLLLDLDSPFASKEEDGGFFVASGDAVRAWVLEPAVKQKLELTESETF